MTGIMCYKKEAVCYEGGSIKVLFSQKKRRGCFKYRRNYYSTQTVNNGQVIFTNLAEGTYIVGWWKF
jgi:hypothetical protein